MTTVLASKIFISPGNFHTLRQVFPILQYWFQDICRASPWMIILYGTIGGLGPCPNLSGYRPMEIWGVWLCK